MSMPSLGCLSIYRDELAVHFTTSLARRKIPELAGETRGTEPCWVSEESTVMFSEKPMKNSLKS